MVVVAANRVTPFFILIAIDTTHPEPTSTKSSAGQIQNNVYAASEQDTHAHIQTNTPTSATNLYYFIAFVRLYSTLNRKSLGDAMFAACLRRGMDKD